MEIIEIEGMEFYAYHGCFKEEQIVGNKFIVDLYVEADLSKPSKTDDVHDTLNYQIMYNLINQEMKKKSHLLENIAERILNALSREFSEIKKSKVKVSKINPPMGGKIEKVSVTLIR